MSLKYKTITIGAHRGFIIEPETTVPEEGRPWLWYAPTFIGKNPNQSNEWLFHRLLDNGFAIAGMDVGESYGSPTGRSLYSQFYRKIVEEYKLAPKACLFAQSRGGPMLYNWAVENPEKVECIVGIYTVCDLRSYPGLQEAAPAYGLDAGKFALELKLHNPIDRLKPLAEAGVSILHLHGDLDSIVPLHENSQAFSDRYKVLGGRMELTIIPNKGHEEVPEFFESCQVLKFILSHN